MRAALFAFILSGIQGWGRDAAEENKTPEKGYCFHVTERGTMYVLRAFIGDSDQIAGSLYLEETPGDATNGPGWILFDAPDFSFCGGDDVPPLVRALQIRVLQDEAAGIPRIIDGGPAVAIDRDKLDGLKRSAERLGFVRIELERLRDGNAASVEVLDGLHDIAYGYRTSGGGAE